MPNTSMSSKHEAGKGGIFSCPPTLPFLPTMAAQIFKHFMSSAMEAELGALFIKSKLAQLHHTPVELGHTQPPTPIQMDNLTAYGVVTNKIIPRPTKAKDIRFHWLWDREQQQHFSFYWQPGKTNYADHWTKHHLAAHHKLMHQVFSTPSTTSCKQNTFGRSMSGGSRCTT